jgi:hypothetical protein
MKFECFRQTFEQSSNIKFHKYFSIGRRVVACGLTDMTKVIDAFRNIANAPKNSTEYHNVIKTREIKSKHKSVSKTSKEHNRHTNFKWRLPNFSGQI